MPYKHRFGPFAGEIYRVPMAYPYRWPTGPERLRRRGVRGVRRRRARAGRRGQHRRRHPRADPGRGRVHRPGAGLRQEGRRLVHRATASCSSPTRCRPGSAAPVTGSPPSTRASSPTSSPPPRASPAACRSPALTGRADVMDAIHVGGLGGTYGGNPVACAAALGRHRDDEGGRPARSGASRSRRCSARASRRSRTSTASIGDIRGRGAMLAVELVSDLASQDARRRPHRRGSTRPATPTAW